MDRHWKPVPPLRGHRPIASLPPDSPLWPSRDAEVARAPGGPAAATPLSPFSAHQAALALTSPGRLDRPFGYALRSASDPSPSLPWPRGTAARGVCVSHVLPGRWPYRSQGAFSKSSLGSRGPSAPLGPLPAPAAAFARGQARGSAGIRPGSRSKARPARCRGVTFTLSHRSRASL